MRHVDRWYPELIHLIRVTDTMYLDKAFKHKIVVNFGKYHVRVSSLRPFRDSDNMLAYQTWN